MYIPRTTFKEKYIFWKKNSVQCPKHFLKSLNLLQGSNEEKNIVSWKKQAKWAKSLSQAKNLSLFASHFLSAPKKFSYKLLIIILDSISQDTRAYFIGSIKLTKKVVGLSTSNLTWLSSILDKKWLYMTSSISCWWLPCFSSYSNVSWWFRKNNKKGSHNPECSCFTSCTYN